jgi:hypothetical protein
MTRHTSDRAIECHNLKSSYHRPRATAISALALCVLSLIPTIVQAAAPGVVLWNKLGSASEVLNSAYGPNLDFFNTPNFVDVVGNPDYVPGIFGNGLSIGPGSYFNQAREHTVVWSGLDQYLSPEQGTISVWYKQNSDPISFEHGVYRLFDGGYGLGSGIGLQSIAAYPDPGPPLLYFGMAFGGTDTEVSYNISPFNGTWIHVAGVWDRNGIANTADTIRLYINGSVVASTTIGGWGTTVGQYADIAGGNDQKIAGQFAIDNLKVYNVAVTDFSDRFVESIPEPASASLVFVAMVFLAASRSMRS